MRRHQNPLPVKPPRWWTLGVWLLIWAVIAWYFYDGDHRLINWYVTLMWTLPVGVAFIGFYGVQLSRKIIREHPTPENVPTINIPLDVVITTIGTVGVFGALRRVINSTRVFERHFSNLTITVVTEDGHKATALNQIKLFLLNQISGVELLIVPKSYQTPKGAEFKARAAEYALRMRIEKLGGIPNIPFDHWRFHIDDDTAVGEDTACALAEFIRTNIGPGSLYLAQGVLAYREQDSANSWMRLADSIRTFDDLSRFPTTTATGHPVAGLHGENMLMRTVIEAEIGWDFPGEMVEDSRAALEFAHRYPGKSAWHPGRVYGAAPTTALDFVRQRGRWAEGMWKLAFNRTIPLRQRLLIIHNMIVWGLGVFQPAAVVLGFSALVGDYNVSPVTAWVAPLWVTSVAYTYWAYWEGLRQNALASGRKAPRLWERIALPPCILWFSVLEGAAGTWGVVRAFTKKERTFYNIAKPV